jgi:hypothetical protein
MADPYLIDTAEAYYQATGKLLENDIDQLWQQTSVGSIQTAIGDNIYGINHRQTPGSIGINRDYYGLTFFTRPRMNLSSDNLRTIRQFGPLLSIVPNSYQRIVRCLLDPTLAQSQGISSDFVDPQQAFIPLLTNTLLSCTGWPDVEVQSFTAHEGVAKETYGFVDSVVEQYGTYDITATFRNIPGDPILLMMMTWLWYSSLVYRGMIIPYPDALINNEIDYMTRVYRLVLDPSRRFVTKIAATGASYPTNAPYGAAINHDADHPINQNNSQIAITFHSYGVMYMDDILVDEFNRTSGLFNDGMQAQNFHGKPPNQTNPYYTKVPLAALPIFNNRGYPRINPITYELEWWVDTQEYNNRLGLSQTYQSQKVQVHTAR